MVCNYRYNFQNTIYLKGIGINKRYIVRLTAQEQKELENLVKKGKTQAYRVKHANILLAIDADGQDWPDHQAAKAYKCHQNTVRNVRQRFVEQGLEAARLLYIVCGSCYRKVNNPRLTVVTNHLVA